MSNPASNRDPNSSQRKTDYVSSGDGGAVNALWLAQMGARGRTRAGQAARTFGERLWLRAYSLFKDSNVVVGTRN